MSKFTNDATGVVVSVADHKDDRFADGWTKDDAESQAKRSPGRPKSTTK